MDAKFLDKIIEFIFSAKRKKRVFKLTCLKVSNIHYDKKNNRAEDFSTGRIS